VLALGRLLTAGIVGVVLACGAQPGPVSAVPAGSATSAAKAAAGTVNCAHLRTRAPDIEGCPPAGLALDQPSLAHAAGVSDVEAQHMGEGFARSYAIANWAINQGYSMILRAGLISSPEGQATASSFGDDLRHIYEAQRAGTRYRIDPPLRLVAIRAVTVEPAVSAQATFSKLTPGPYALVLTLQGPYMAYLGSQVVVSHAAAYSAHVLMFGDLRDDADLGGWIWSWGGYVTCDQPWAASLCRA
jgi:hypothetical protein